MLHPISVAALCVLVCPSYSFPMCTDGHPPLMEFNDAFPCSRGCPKGFDCEMQDPLLTASMGICCANRTELRRLYGSDNQKHADPIWDRKDSSQSIATTSTTALPSPLLSTPGVEKVDGVATEFHEASTTSTSSSVFTTEEARSSFPVPTTLPNEGNSVVVTEDDEVFDETSSASATVEEEAIFIDGSSATNSTASTALSDTGETSIPTESAQERSHESNSAQKEGDGANGEQPKSPLVPEQTNQTLNSTVFTSASATVSPLEALNTTVVEGLVDENDLEGSSVPLEDSVSVSSARVDDETLTREPDVKESPLKEDQSASHKTAHDVDRRGATGDSLLVLDKAAPKEGQSTKKNAVVEAVDLVTPSNETSDSSEDSNKEQVISDTTQNNGEDIPPVKDEQTIYSCERQPYIFRCRSDSVDTQPTIRWYLSEKGECEYYPWGYCPGDRVAESSTIRTKLDCERECIKREKTSANGTLPKVLAEFSADAGKTGDELEPEASILEEKSDDATAEKSIVVEPTVASDLTEPSNNNLSISEHDKGVNETMDHKNQEKDDVHERLPAATELDTLITSTIDKSTNESDALVADEKKVHVEEEIENPPIQNIEETSQNRTSEMEAVEAVMIEPKENVGNEGSKKHACDDSSEEEQATAKTDESEQNETELEEGSGEVETRKSKNDPEQVLCSRSAYRFLCESGMPSQFVYRWEMENGTCQSFPYGYCLSEWNHPHPRTPDECEQLCQK